MANRVALLSEVHDPFGLNGFLFGLDAPTVLSLNTSGTLSRALVAANTYTFSLRNEANVGGALGNRTALMDAQFDWHIALLVLGRRELDNRIQTLPGD